MPYTREDLVDLLGETVADCMPTECLYEVADHLIANGVRLEEKQATSDEIKWIPVTERLPEHGDVVLCFMKFGEQRILQWDNVSNWWLGYGHGDDWQKADVTHWCCLHQPQKGE